MGKQELYEATNLILAPYFGVDCEYPILSNKQWRKRLDVEFPIGDMGGFGESVYRRQQGKNIRNLKPKSWLNMNG
jgi:hypothetical protein